MLEYQDSRYEVASLKLGDCLSCKVGCALETLAYVKVPMHG